MGNVRKQRRYSVSERAEAIRRAEEVGPHAAARELGIPTGTITCWRYQARRQQQASAATPAPKRSPGRSSSSEPCPDARTQIHTRVEASSSNGHPKQNGSARRVAKAYTPSERKRTLEHAAAEGVTEASRKFGVSRFTIYEWQRRARLHAEGKLTSSPVTGGDDDQAAARDHRILSEWKAHPGLGPSQVRNQLRRQGLKVSLHTVRCVLEENGYVPPKVRREPVHDQRYEAVRPNHLWHLDFLHRHVHKQKVHVLIASTYLPPPLPHLPIR